MNCNKCGSELEAGMKFCPVCGNNTSSPFQEEPPKAPSPDPGEEIKQPKAEARQPQSYTPSYEKEASNGFAIASLVLGICSFFSNALFMIPSILAVIFGIIGIIRAKNIKKGLGLSIAGLVLGLLSLFLYIYFIVLATYLFTGLARELGPDIIQMIELSIG